MDEPKKLKPGDPGHKAVSPEDRSKEVHADGAYKEQAHQGHEDKSTAEAEKAKEVEQAQLTVLDRLMRVDARQTFNMVFKDEDGEFAVPIRVLRGEERMDVVKLIAGLGAAGAQDNLELIDEELKNLDEMAASLVTDTEIADGVRAGKLTSRRSLEILKFSLEHTISLEEAGASFRIN